MTIRREDVLHVARLAELDVAEQDLATLVGQMGRIVEFVAQLNQVPSSEQAPAFLAGPRQVALRPDEVRTAHLDPAPADMAPEFQHGLFVVPRLGAMEGTE